MSNDLQLRDYQIEAVNTVNALPAGSRQVVAIATGLGKTVIGSHFAFKKRMLWISHRDELVHQPEKYFVTQGYRFGVDQAGEYPDIHDQVVSASVQTINRDNRLHAYSPDEFDLIVVDEMQHSAAPTYRKILDYFHADKVIGLTATPKRGDGVRLSDIFDGICFTRTLQWGIKNHWLSDIRYARVQANFDMKKVKKQMGDFSEHDLSDAMEKSDNAEVVAKAYLDYCVSDNIQTIIYCPSISICNLVYSEVAKILPDDQKGTVKILTGATDRDIRRKTLDQYKEGKIHCIINCMVLTEGTDLPNTSAIIIDRPTANQTLFTQIVGRGTRLYPGKDHCMIIDVVGKNAQNRNVMTAFNLFGIDPNAVPNKILKQSEGMNMSEFADMLDSAGTVTNLTSYLKLQVEMVDIFSGDLLGMVKDNREQGVKALSKAYQKYLNDQKDTLKDKGLDFGDLVVRIMPSERRKYQIQATYNGYVYLSEPDAVGKSIISFDFSHDGMMRDESVLSAFNDVESTPITFEDAVNLATDFLMYVAPSNMRYLWSETERAERDKRPATDKQSYSLRVNHCIASKGASLLDANNAFTVFNSIDNFEDQKKDYEGLYEASQKKRKTKKYKEWSENFAESQSDELTEDQIKKWNICKRIIKDAKANVEKAEHHFLTGFDADGKRMVQIAHSSFSMSHSSPAQDNYINSLVSQLNRTNNKVSLSPNTLKRITRSQASVLIDTMNRMKDLYVPKNVTVLTDLNEYIAKDNASHESNEDSEDNIPLTIKVTQTLLK